MSDERTTAPARFFGEGICFISLGICPAHRPLRLLRGERSPAADGSRSTPLRDTEGSVHWLRLKQHAARLPDLSFESVFSIRIIRVSGFLVEAIQRIQSQRARGVMSIHRLRAFASAASARARS